MERWKQNIKVLRPAIPYSSRILVISDIHANLAYLQSLLQKAAFCDNDILIIAGDFLEKGSQNLETLRFIMQLCSKGNTYALCGNCDSWSDFADSDNFSLEGPKLLNYMLWKRSGLLYEMFLDCGIEVNEQTDVASAMPEILLKYNKEWDFLRELPGAVELQHYIFVHGGIQPDIPIDNQLCGDCMKLDNFRSKGWSFNKWVIVGHWPVTLYIEDHVCAYPIIDRDRKIVSIDGGCVLKDDGQLNALVIPYEGSSDFSCIWYDTFPVKTAASEQKASSHSYYIRWGDSEVEVLESGKEFSHCKHVRTGYEMDILTKYLFVDSHDGKTHTNDCSDYSLEVHPGDKLSIIEETSRGYYVKNKGTSGWYYGKFDEP